MGVEAAAVDEVLSNLDAFRPAPTAAPEPSAGEP
jgi:hypothetical protein